MEKHGEKQDKLLPRNLWCWSCKGVIIGATPVSSSLVTENIFKFTCERASCKQTIMLIKKGDEWIPESGASTEQEWEARCLNCESPIVALGNSLRCFSYLCSLRGCGIEPVSVVCKKIGPDLIKEAVELGLENYGLNPTKAKRNLYIL
ncbi:hypothetical protein RHMOL_Rhmol13G0205500 [Rhododendron molle]|uniref:Uncharacterized protein n=1 Tax=Rhododendron molle TaxID=49168 RepID=A0ACC0L9E6_RHOML|nr:hypothetical protein RHMOL_Rhmol13G0205500 [Rhododendron molle]